MLENNFVDSDRDYSLYISVLKALNLSENSSLIDYGCSWGYGSWQLQKAGFDVTSFEISKPRSNFAKNKLKINAYSDLNEINKPADIFFTSHVLEHISNINSVIEIAKKLIKPNGYFVAFTPNGSDVYRKFNPKGWQKGWGFVHPICLDEVFYKSIFKEMPILLDSAPYNLTKINSWVEDKKYFSPNILSLDGNELLLIVKF